jgi:creatinine amidohydrolase
MQLGELNWTQVKDQTHKVVVVPIGALEQHGHHLPLLTDSMIGAEIVRRAEAELGEEFLFLPMLWVGASDHHLSFPGTVSLSAEVYEKVLIDMVKSLVSAGFRRIFLLNSHAGNILPAQRALYEVQLKYRTDKPELWLVFSSWFEIAAKAISNLEGFTQTNVIHACEWETSMIQKAYPHLVKGDFPPAARIPDFPSVYYTPDHSKPSRISVARTMEQVSKTGAFGYPELASPEKGEFLFTTATQEVVTFLREFATWPALHPA